MGSPTTAEDRPLVRASAELQRRIGVLESFRTAYTEAVNVSERWEAVGSGGRTHLELDDRRLDDLAELAGRAAHAAGRDQLIVGKSGSRFSPLLHWRDPFEASGGMASSVMVLDGISAVLGRLRDQLDQAEMNEGTWAFKVGWGLSFPVRARQAVGSNRAAGQLAFWGSVAASIVAGFILLAITTAAAAWVAR